MIKLLIRLH
jgi:hypothetical protein